MQLSQLKKQAFEPFDAIALTKRYFGAVKSMDTASPQVRKEGVAAVLKLWAKDGELTINGPEPIGERRYASTSQLREFYTNRGKGAEKLFKVNVSTVSVANAKSGNRITISGVRYVVNKDGEGLEVPFTHNFELEGKLIKALHIHVGKSAASEVAPLGRLHVEDMGRLAAMAWMVA